MQAHWYFDFISPFSYLQLPRVARWRERVEITPVPVAFGAMLKHFGNVGPAEIPGKREWTYRLVQWQAEHGGMTLKFPPAHPFNPLAALRLCLAAGGGWDAVEAIFAHLWRDGRAGTTAEELAGVGRALGVADVAAAIDAAEVKAQLRRNTEAAIAAGVFGVPTLTVGNERFWGNDASPLIDEWFADPARFDGVEYRRIAALPIGIERAR
jgi:2-hydroxychromene-2-carboxylate isomerase